MRHAMAVAAVAIVAAAGAASAKDGLAFNIRPGLRVNAAQVGYKWNNFFLGGGLEFATASWTHDYEVVHHDTSVFPETTYTYRQTKEENVSIFLPQVAARYYWGGEIGREAGYARPFVGVTAFYSIAAVTIMETGSDSVWKDEPASWLAPDSLGGNLGGTVSFGGEYYLSRHLAFNGEFGVRYLFGSFGQTHRDSESYGYSDVWLDERLGLGLTYTTLGLNFYF
jgi:hypothetical protein